DVATDASGAKGMGGVYNRLVFSERIPARHRSQKIDWKEMFAILHAFLLWHEVWRAVFSSFYSFIRLFANKRIEYEVSSNKVLFLFVNMNKGASIRLFHYSQLKTKQGRRLIKACHYVFSRVIASVELALNNKRNIQSP